MRNNGARSRAVGSGPNANRRYRSNNRSQRVPRAGSSWGRNNDLTQQVQADQARINDLRARIEEQRALNIPEPPNQPSHLYDLNDLPDYNPGNRRNRSARRAFTQRMMDEGIFDIDGDGTIKGSTDGRLIEEYLDGKSKDRLARRVGSGAQYTMDQIMDRLDQLRSSGVLDTDNDGRVEESDGDKTYYWIRRLD